MDSDLPYCGFNMPCGERAYREEREVVCNKCGETWVVVFWKEFGDYHPAKEEDMICPTCKSDEEVELVW